MATKFTEISPKYLQQLDGRISYNTARRRLVRMRKVLGVQLLQLRHLATYWNVSLDELIQAIKSEKALQRSQQ